MKYRLPLLAALFVLLLLYVTAIAQNAIVGNGTIPPGTAAVYLPLVRKSVPTATPLSVGVVVKSSKIASRPSNDFIYIPGEIINKTSVPVYLIRVTGRFFDAKRDLIGERDTYVFSGVVLPGKVSPFVLTASKKAGQIATYETVVSYEAVSSTDFQPLTVISKQIGNNSGIEVSGEFRNTTDNEIHGAVVSVTFYDAVGKVIEADRSFVDVTLAEVQKASYAINLGYNFAYSSYVVQATGY
jgi:hypothetical protein